jgi:hypothetical protein
MGTFGLNKVWKNKVIVNALMKIEPKLQIERGKYVNCSSGNWLKAVSRVSGTLVVN